MYFAQIKTEKLREKIAPYGKAEIVISLFEEIFPYVNNLGIHCDPRSIRFLTNFPKYFEDNLTNRVDHDKFHELMNSDSNDIYTDIKSKWWNAASIIDLKRIIETFDITTESHYTRLLIVRLIVAEYFESIEQKSQHYYAYQDVISTLHVDTIQGSDNFKYQDILSKEKISELVFDLNNDGSLPSQLKINFYKFLNYETLKFNSDPNFSKTLITGNNPEKILDILVEHFDSHLSKQGLDFSAYKLYRNCINSPDERIAPIAIEKMKSIADKQPLKFLTITLGFYGQNMESCMFQKAIMDIIPDLNSRNYLVKKAEKESTFGENRIIEIISNLYAKIHISESKSSACDMHSEEYEYLDKLKLLNPYFNFSYENSPMMVDDTVVSKAWW
jgi:hypothetical protein